jgi:electron transfer flavoprotein alpha subunit
MEKSKQLIAINTDRNAPILQMADLGIVGDGRKVIPEIVRLVRERKKKQDGP